MDWISKQLEKEAYNVTGIMHIVLQTNLKGYSNSNLVTDGGR